MFKLRLINKPKLYKLKCNFSFPNIVIADMQEKTVIPTAEQQIITPDKEYTGLSKVTVEAVTNTIDENITKENIKKDVSILGVVGSYEGNLGTKTITQNGTYKASDDNLDGYSEVNVATSGGTSFQITDASNLFSYDARLDAINELINIISPNCTKFNNMFYYSPSLTTIPQLNTSNGTNFNNMFQFCSNLTTIPQLNTSNGTNFGYMFYSCPALTTIPELNTSNGTNFSSMFYSCSALTTIPELNTSNGTNFSSMFQFCSNLTTIPQLNTSNGTNFNNMLNNCTRLTTIPELNTSNGTNFSSMFYSCKELTDFGGLKYLGKGYLTTASANKSDYKLDLSKSTKLTEQSLINVLNNLYDIATKGCKPQQVVLGSTNLAKLTSEAGQQALSNAQAKGWTVS